MILAGLQSANEEIQRNNSALEDYLESLKRDPELASQMISMAPKINKIKDLSDDLVQHIDALNRKLTEGASPDQVFQSEKGGHILFLQLYNFKYSLIDLLDIQVPERKILLYKKMPLLPFVQEISAKIPDQLYEQRWIDSSFGSSTPLMCQAILYTIKNDALISAQKILEYCRKGIYIPTYCEAFLPVTSISSENVKPGETIVISAGFGKFVKPMNPAITINGKTIRTEEHFVHYPIKAGSKPGRYTIPVHFEYTTYDGTREKVWKNFSYTISE